MDERNCLVNSSIIVAFAKNYGRLFLELDCRSPNPTKDELAMDKDVSQHESALDGLPIDLKPYIVSSAKLSLTLFLLNVLTIFRTSCCPLL